MSRIYSASFSKVTYGAGVPLDVFTLVVPAGKPVEIVYCTLSQSSDYGEAEAEGIPIEILRGAGTVGSGGTTPTIFKHDNRGAASSVTVRANDTTLASAGTELLAYEEAWNVQIPWIYAMVKEARIRTDSDDDIIVVRMLDGPADALTASGTIIWKEGG